MGLVKSRAATLICGAALGLIAVQGAAAQSNVNTSNVTLLERLVIGLGGAPKVAIDTPQAVTVINQEDLDNVQASTTGELFKGVPGVTMVGSERQLGQAFNIRGIGTTENSSDGARVVVNVDGTPKFNEQYRMGSFFSDPELYKQVEVLRGPASSTLYGAGAIGGVINFTTKDASDFIREGYTGAFRVKGGFTSDGLGTLTSAVLAQQVTDAFEILAAGNWRRQEDLTLAKGGTLPGSGFDTLSGLVKGTWHFGDNDEQELELSYQRWYSNAEQQAYSQTGTQAIFGVIDRRVIDQTAVLHWENPATDNPWIDLKVNLSFSDTSNFQYNHRPAAGAPLSNFGGSDIRADTEYVYRTWQLSADNTIEWVGETFENFFTFGLQASTQDRIVNRPNGVPLPAHPEGNEKRLGLFAQDEFIWDEKLTIIVGGRGDFHWVDPVTAGVPNRDGSALSPKLSVLYAVNDNLNVFGSLAHTERLPTIDELYSVSAAKFASLDLRKERANSVEGGFSVSGWDLWTSGDQASIKTTAFYSRIEDMIVSNTGAGVPYYGNIGQAELYGVEVEGAYNSEIWFANLAYSLTIGRNLVTDTPLTTVPQSKVVATLGARNPEWNLEYGARLTVGNKGDYVAAGDGTAEPFATMDVFASWKPDYGALAGTEVQFGIDNLFNADYRENLSTDRSTARTFKLTLAKQFDY